MKSNRRHVRLLSTALTLVMLMAGFVSAGVEKPLVIFNHDAGAGSLTQFEPPITPEQVCRQFNELEGTSVDVFLFCCNIGGDVFLYPTNIAERCGANISDWNVVHKYYRNELRRAKGNLEALRKAGLDPIEIIQRRSRELGIRFWITMRMNEIHEDDVRWGSLRSQFKLANRHMLLEKDYPLTGIGYAEKFGYSYAWDYGRSETRRHIVAVLTEMLDRYELDGLELDFMRHPLFFRRGEQASSASLMTELLRKLRAEVDRVSKKKGRPIVLAVRVYPSLAQNEKIGLEPRTWIKQGLVDLVTPMDPDYMDMQPKLREFVDAARGTNVKIAGGLENYTHDYGPLSKQQAFAAASAFLEQGAGAIYFFNYDCHRHKGRLNKYTSQEVEILTTIGHPERYVRADKHYFVTRDPSRKPPEKGRTIQLPFKLTSGTGQKFTFTVGDDLKSARSDEVLKAVRLTITFQGYDSKNDPASIRLNEQSPGPEHLRLEDQTVRWDNAPARQGNNVLTIILSGSTEKTISVEKIELQVDYR